jgi:hypothetical protein
MPDRTSSEGPERAQEKETTIIAGHRSNLFATSTLMATRALELSQWAAR